MDQFVVRDPVIIKFKRCPKGYEYYGILCEIDIDTISIVGKPLSWVLAGDLKLDQYTFNTNSIDDVQLNTLEAAEVARDLVEKLNFDIYYEIEIKQVYDRLCNYSLENGAKPFFDIDKLFKYILELRQLQEIM